MPVGLNLLLTAIVFGAIGIFSPTRVALAVMMLAGETAPWARALAYAAGSTAVFGAVVIVGLLGFQTPGLRDASSIVNIVLGLIMVGAAAAMVIIDRRRRERPPRPPSRSLLSAAGIGAAVSVQSFGRLLILLAGAYRLGSLGAPLAPSMTSGALMLAIWQTPIWAPMLLYVFRRERFDALAQRARPALDRIEGGIVGALLVAAVGILLLLEGLLG
jgi:hypothetical protein